MDLFRAPLRVAIFRASVALWLVLMRVHTLPAQSAPVSGYSVPELTAFDAAAQSLVAKYQLPGAALAVMRDGASYWRADMATRMLTTRYRSNLTPYSGLAKNPASLRPPRSSS